MHDVSGSFSAEKDKSYLRSIAMRDHQLVSIFYQFPQLVSDEDDSIPLFLHTLTRVS